MCKKKKLCLIIKIACLNDKTTLKSQHRFKNDYHNV